MNKSSTSSNEPISFIPPNNNMNNMMRGTQGGARLPNNAMLPTNTSGHLPLTQAPRNPTTELPNASSPANNRTRVLYEPQSHNARFRHAPPNLPQIHQNERRVRPTAPINHVQPIRPNDNVLPTAVSMPPFPPPNFQFPPPALQCDHKPGSANEPVLLLPACNPFHPPMGEFVPFGPPGEYVLPDPMEYMLSDPMADFVPVELIDPMLQPHVPCMIDPVHDLMLYEAEHYDESVQHLLMHPSEPLCPDDLMFHAMPLVPAHLNAHIMHTSSQVGNLPSLSAEALSPSDSLADSTAQSAEESRDESIKALIERSKKYREKRNKEFSTKSCTERNKAVENVTEKSVEHSTEVNLSENITKENTKHCAENIAHSTDWESEDSTGWDSDHSTAIDVENVTEENLEHIADIRTECSTDDSGFRSTAQSTETTTESDLSVPSVTATTQPIVAEPSPQSLHNLLTSSRSSSSDSNQPSVEPKIQMAQLPQPSPQPNILPPPPPPPPAPAPPMVPSAKSTSRHQAAQLSNLDTKLMEPISCEDSKMEEQLYSAIGRILCGLVALVMAGQMLGVDIINVHDTLALAKDKNYTKQGEMFSAKNMHLLAEELYPKSNCHLVVNDGCEIRYDADRNHEPCLKKGHKAHWALITGFLGLAKDVNISTMRTLTKDDKLSNLYHSKDCKLDNNMLKSLCSDGQLYVYGSQGKSRYTAVWSLDSLLKSNSQLHEVEPERMEDRDSYVLPDRLEEDLCSKIIFLGGQRSLKVMDTLNDLFSSHSMEALMKPIHLTETHSNVSFNRKDIVIRNTKGSSEQLTEFWIKVLKDRCQDCSTDFVNEKETFTVRKNAVTAYVLKRLGTLIIDGNFLLVDLWYKKIMQTASLLLLNRDEMMSGLLTSQNKVDTDESSPIFEQKERLNGHLEKKELDRDDRKQQDDSTTSCDYSMSEQLQTLRNACVKDGGTYIYQLWKNLLNSWLSDSKNKVFIVTPFLDSGKLKDICNIVLSKQHSANINRFYVRQKCDDPLFLMDIIRISTAKFTVAEKMVIKKEIINKMVCDFTSRFHCKFIACVKEDNSAEVLVTSANFTRQHFNCSNAESVFYQDMTVEQFRSRFLQPLEAIT
ncbi:hypothetical protein FSP39_014291 [Pinctada imbricata]|uniref:Actin maturation protease n=1 Tax=Pinctada imbricata TaxID=66713 RepID=A0AA88Y4J8_PINIB|nr:hypothetical protein FSP39_014291 [Pinctada imbricata]